MTGKSSTKIVVFGLLETWFLCGMTPVQIMDTESADSFYTFHASSILFRGNSWTLPLDAVLIPFSGVIKIPASTCTWYSNISFAILFWSRCEKQIFIVYLWYSRHPHFESNISFSIKNYNKTYIQEQGMFKLVWPCLL